MSVIRILRHRDRNASSLQTVASSETTQRQAYLIFHCFSTETLITCHILVLCWIYRRRIIEIDPNSVYIDASSPYQLFYDSHFVLIV